VNTNLLGKLKSDFLDLDIVRIECVDNTTAANTNGIAGKDISCISDIPNEFKLSDAWGKISPSISDTGNIYIKNDLRDRSFLSAFLNLL
jgi:hypothetical protein